MVMLPNNEFQELVPLLREKGFYEPQNPRKISWPEYNLAQIEDAQETLEFIRDSVDATRYMKTEGKVGKPLTDPKTLAKAVLVCEALGAQCPRQISELGTARDALDDRDSAVGPPHQEPILGDGQGQDRGREGEGSRANQGLGVGSQEEHRQPRNQRDHERVVAEAQAVHRHQHRQPAPPAGSSPVVGSP